MQSTHPPLADDLAALAKVPLSRWAPPEDLLAAMSGGSAFLLESAGESRPFARWSMLGTHPVARFVSKAGSNRFHWLSRGQKWTWNEPPLQALRRSMLAFPKPKAQADLPFSGGAVGVLSYELGRSLLPVPPKTHDDLDLPELSFYFFDRFILFDRDRGQAWAVAYARGEDTQEAEREAQLRAKLLAESLSELQDIQDGPDTPVDSGLLEISRSFSGDQYRSAVARCIEEIHNGEAYELCLTGRFETEYRGDPLELYRRLRRDNPAPFGGFLRFPEAALISSSPERFLRVDAEGHVEARPIKGTRKRGASPAEDAALRAELKSSRKDRAENTMIVDLLRNDLNRVCETGSVTVPELCVIEDYASLFQMVSTITGTLAADHDRFDLLASAFPGGSMTGAPKIAAMKILESLEPCVRGYYSGAMGYLGFDGGMDLSMVIRAIQLIGSRALVGAGGAVVAGSDPESEWREALAKASPTLSSIAKLRGMTLPSFDEL
ncbi:aminodeoxychorismate synthase component I [bacterium]|nr:aminodeoxychorismate synthase component I [bacterium]